VPSPNPGIVRQTPPGRSRDGEASQRFLIPHAKLPSLENADPCFSWKRWKHWPSGNHAIGNFEVSRGFYLHATVVAAALFVKDFI
jgi:hypothetical protein